MPDRDAIIERVFRNDTEKRSKQRKSKIDHLQEKKHKIRVWGRNGTESVRTMRAYSGRERRKKMAERRRNLLRRSLPLAAGAAILLCIVLLICVLPGRAGEEGETSYKYYRCVTVTAEEGVPELAARYADPAHYRNRTAYVREVGDINHMAAEGGDIPEATPGTRLVVPYYSTVFVQ